MAEYHVHRSDEESVLTIVDGDDTVTVTLSAEDAAVVMSEHGDPLPVYRRLHREALGLEPEELPPPPLSAAEHIAAAAELLQQNVAGTTVAALRTNVDAVLTAVGDQLAAAAEALAVDENA
jgi:hypothetical protein